MCGVVSTQSLFEILSSIRDLYRRGWRTNSYTPVDGNTNVLFRVGKYQHLLVIFIMAIGVLCQVGGLSSVTTFLVIAYNEGQKSSITGTILAVPCLVVLSMAWSRFMQKFTFLPSTDSIQRAERVLGHQQSNVTAKWKASKFMKTL